MLGVCRLPWIELGLNERHYEYFYQYVTGNELTLEQLLALSNDVYDLTRLINVKLGVSRKDDSLPYKVHSSPPLTGPNAGKVVDKDAFQNLLSRYYRERGWNDDGLPSDGVEKKFDD
jgi:aldehyde:ferredoxin oxidoreductase